MPATKLYEFFLRDVKNFTDCSEHFLQDVFALSEKVSYLPGEILRTAGRKNTHVWVVFSGKVHIVDGNDTVLDRNDVVGIYSQMNELGFCVYTAYAAREGAICLIISQQLLNTMFKKYPLDNVIIMRNTLKCANRRPRAHILAAMQMQVSNSQSHFGEGSVKNLNPNKYSHSENRTFSKSAPTVLEFPASTKAHSTLGNEMVPEGSLSVLKLNYGNNYTEDSMSKIRSNGFACRQERTFSKSGSNVLKFQESMDRRSILEIQRDGQDCLTEMDIRLNAVFMTEHANCIAQINLEKSKSLAQATFQRARRHSANISGGALFYSNVILQEKYKSATEYVTNGQTSHLKLGHTLKFWNFRCACLSCWVMVAVYVTLFSNASPFHWTET